MRKLCILSVILVVNLFFVWTQAENDTDRIQLSVVVPDQTDPLPDASVSYLKNALIHAISSSGLAGVGPNSRFVVAAKVDLIQKTISRTIPSQQLYTLNLTLYIGDGIEGIAYATHVVNIKGIGENPTKAYNNAFSGIKFKSEAFDNFVTKGKDRILSYYAQNCNLIIEQAKALATVGEYDEAIWQLINIPSIHTECYKKALYHAGPVFQKKIDQDCKRKITEAQSIWNANQNQEGARIAGEILATIHPNATNYSEINTLAESIEKRIREVDKREWKFTKEFNIGLERERISVERDMIKAYRDIGVAWGQNQPQNINYRSFW